MIGQPIQLGSKREQVRSFLLGQIAAGLRAGERVMPESRLVTHLGVSKSTVRLALEELASAGVIVQEQGRGTYVKDDRHPLVREHLQRQVHMVGYVAPFEFDDRFMLDISLGVDAALSPDRFLVMSKHLHVPTCREADVLPRLAERLQGLILLSTMTPEAVAVLSRLAERRFPLVLVDRYAPGLPISSVTTDNHEAGRLATEHLLQLGHRRITHLTLQEDLTSSREREEGYLAGMRLHGLAPDVVRLQRGESFHAELERLADSLAANDAAPRAVFAMCDALALDLLAALRQRRVAVPEQVSLVGVDDNADARLATPPLTTIAQPKRQMGFKAGRMLQELILGDRQPGLNLQLQPSLVVRQTTAPAQS